MITEDYVSFEIAKLLKEKGFNEICAGYYDRKGRFDMTLSKVNNIRWEGHYITGNISAPTLQMAMKWLREKHNIIISIHPNDFKSNGTACYKADIWIKDKYVYEYEYNKEGNYDYTDREKETFEESCEDAIKYCLEHLI